MYLIPLTQSVLLKPDRMTLMFTPLSYNHMFWGTELKKERQRFYQFYLVILKNISCASVSKQQLYDAVFF